MPFRYTWPLVAFFTINIIIATMFLRWHYVIDVVAGLGLACAALSLSAVFTRLEFKRRLGSGLSECWPLFRRASATDLVVVDADSNRLEEAA